MYSKLPYLGECVLKKVIFNVDYTNRGDGRGGGDGEDSVFLVREEKESDEMFFYYSYF